jgi:hypothetical protein
LLQQSTAKPVGLGITNKRTSLAEAIFWRNTSKASLCLGMAAATFMCSAAHAQYSDGVVKIGILTDMASLYADNGGAGSVTAVKLAVEDFGAAAKGMKVEIISADHQNNSSAQGQRPRTSPVRNATPTPSTGPTTPATLPTGPARQL